MTLHQAIAAELLEQVQLKVRNGEWTVRAIARETGISQPHVQQWFHGRKHLSPALADHIIVCLRIHAEQLCAAAIARKRRENSGRRPTLSQ